MQWLRERGLPVSPSKCKILSNKQSMLRRVSEFFVHEGFVAAQVTRHLGQEASGEHRRRTCVRQSRRKAAYARLGRIAVLRKAGASVKDVIRAGPLVMSTWGCSTMGLTSTQLKQDRLRVFRATANLPKTASVGLAFLCNGPRLAIDPASLHHGDVLETWRNMLATSWMDADKLADALASSARRLLGSPHPWRR
eukprot:6474070-Amphidinium_carterae.1